MTEIVLMADPRVATLPVIDCGEPLVDLRSWAEFRLSDYRANDTGSFAHVREGIARRLSLAQKELPNGLRLLIVEGYRPYELQHQYFMEYRRDLGNHYPNATDDELNMLTSRYVSPPDIAPHVSGAAVDLTLCDISGKQLDMGTRVNADPEESQGACYMHAENISERARRNRRLLSNALTRVGFVNYPTEWWHWSSGDRYWAMATGESAAIYGPVIPSTG